MGQIPDAYKTYQVCDFAPGSGAVVLSNEGHSTFHASSNVIRSTYKFHKFVKILSKDGLDAGNIKFTSFGKVSKLKAITYNENKETGAWIPYEFDKDNLYKEKVDGSKTKFEYKIPMPEVRAGSILEILVEITYLNSIIINDWQFQDEYPVLKSTYETFYPNDFEFNQEIKSHYPIHVDNPETTTMLFLGRNLDAKRYHYVGEKLPPINFSESFAPPPHLFASHIEFSLTGINSDIFKDKQFMAKNYEQFCNWLLKSPEFGKHLDKKNQGLVDKLGVELLQKDDLMVRAQKIYTAIQNNIEWDGYYSVLPEISPAKTIKAGRGEVADINMLLIATLREAGLKAYPLISSTVENGVPHPVYPDIMDFNYLLCALKLDDQYHILDASRTTLPFGMRPKHTLNHNAFIVDKVQQGWISTKDDVKNALVHVVNMEMADEKLHCKTLSKQGKYASYPYYIVTKDEEKLNELNQAYQAQLNDDWEWDDFETMDIQLGKPVITKGTISRDLDDDEMLYIEPVLLRIFDEQPFTEQGRISSVIFPCQTSYNYLFNFKKPEGYQLEEHPESVVMVLPNNGGQFKYIFEEREDKVSVHVIITVNQTFYIPEEYEYIQTFFKKIYDKYDEIIVFKKS